MGDGGSEDFGFADLNRKIREKNRKLQKERDERDRLLERTTKAATDLLEAIRNTPEQPSLYTTQAP